MDDQRKLLAAIFDGLLHAGLGDQDASRVATVVLRRVEPLFMERQERYQELREIAEHMLAAWPIRLRGPELDAARHYLRLHCTRCGRLIPDGPPRMEILCASCI